MTKQAGLAATMLVMLAAFSPAAATASLTCDAEDPFLSLHVQGVVGLADVNLTKANATIKTRSSGTTVVDLSDEHLVQRWATGRDVRLRFFRAEPSYVLDLTVETRGKKDDEQERPGIYRLEFTSSPPGMQSIPITRNGRASCTIG